MVDSVAVTLESGGRDGGRGTVEFMILVKGLAIMPYELLTDVIKAWRPVIFLVDCGAIGLWNYHSSSGVSSGFRLG